MLKTSIRAISRTSVTQFDTKGELGIEELTFPIFSEYCQVAKFSMRWGKWHRTREQEAVKGASSTRCVGSQGRIPSSVLQRSLFHDRNYRRTARKAPHGDGVARPGRIRRRWGERRGRVSDVTSTRNTLTARTQASKILSRPNITQHLEAVREANRPRYDRGLAEWGKIAHSDLGQMLDISNSPPTLRKNIPPSVRQAIQRTVITPIPARDPKKGKPKGKIDVTIYDKRGALDKMSQHLGIYEPMPPMERLFSGLPERVANGISRALKKSASCAEA